MKKVIHFLEQLEQHNDRDWFNEHKNLYKEALAEFTDLMERLIGGIAQFDQSVSGLKARDCIYRIYRDTRFSNDKTPYKTHFGGFIVPHGKKSGYAGYYLHIEPTENGMLGCSMLATGLVMPEPVILKSIREEMLDYGAEIIKSVEESDGFVFDTDNSLKRNPQGFPKETPYDFLLRMKDHFIWKRLSKDDLLAPDAAGRMAESFRTTKPYLDHLNRAIDFAKEEMM